LNWDFVNNIEGEE